MVFNLMNNFAPLTKLQFIFAFFSFNVEVRLIVCLMSMTVIFKILHLLLSDLLYCRGQRHCLTSQRMFVFTLAKESRDYDSSHWSRATKEVLNVSSKLDITELVSEDIPLREP